ncbi:tRNA (5-methylaminomethyl-2-thiouridine)(34)-methyltransferase MnmD [Antarcticibacterium arcticum]|uniref:tRNA (5-methylaminomethyl-2-thiouridine)(34)-methyltransferase MnmD n=1 Tax=Antarcticibacterium arcticum TaxID=2585771 RepID=A0A5B8YPK4_9FLAO|nr:tRNA (5-methylaminomethyl-2-thiouridine)(34)-methyltransferase MnmD [Antarcticibacterium arcticum]QED37819.1 tRNA (5-methylaminomethyl-2-thiouridine)(34)-methyltransferase MnmD [Antarcticibacterium arcticum]
MKREIINTGDGSTTIHLPEWNEQYHSKHGAIREARHVFIEMGLKKCLAKEFPEISILEIGFGTGLNALVTWSEVRDREINIKYTGVEAYPVAFGEVEKLNFPNQLAEPDAEEVFKLLHSLEWEIPEGLTPNFSLLKQKKFFADITDVSLYDLIYFDAFGARVQPELWTEEIFERMFRASKPGGLLVTYAAKGSVRRAMQSAGFIVERLPGPPGKREMLRATKPGL